MTNNNTTLTKESFTMTNTPHDVRVIKHMNGTYNTFANFTTVKEAVSYMRRWSPDQIHNWYILDANGNRLQFNEAGQLLVK